MRGLRLLAQAWVTCIEVVSEESSLANWMGGNVDNNRKIFQLLGKINQRSKKQAQYDQLLKRVWSYKWGGNITMELPTWTWAWSLFLVSRKLGDKYEITYEETQKGGDGGLYSIPIGGAGVRVSVPKCAKTQELNKKCWKMAQRNLAHLDQEEKNVTAWRNKNQKAEKRNERVSCEELRRHF